jgi:hypothetical protein
MRHETFPIDSRSDRGKTREGELSIRCEVRQGTRPWKLARLIDLSETGFQLAWLPEYDASKPVKIRIPGIEPLTAEIRWTRGKRIGCEFASPLHVAVFEHLVRASGGAR